MSTIYDTYERNLLIHCYCSDEFNYLNWVDFYYRKIDANGILMVFIIFTLAPILYYQIAIVTDRFLTKTFK